MSQLQISDRRSIENLMRTSGHARWVRRLEIHVSGGDATGNTVSADLERPPAMEAADVTDGAGVDPDTDPASQALRLDGAYSAGA